MAASTGALPMLRKSFSCLADVQTNAISPYSLKEKSESLKSTSEQASTKSYDDCLPDCGRARALYLTFTSTMSEEILKSCFPSDRRDENLLYRSSLHGRRLNRFWSNIEGYHAPLGTLVSASSADVHENSTTERNG